jgi:hypothetical protein
VPQSQPADYDFASSRQFEGHRPVDNQLNYMQFVVGFGVPGQLPFTFNILKIHACVKSVNWTRTVPAAKPRAAFAAAFAAELPPSPTWLGSHIKTSFFPQLIGSWTRLAISKIGGFVSCRFFMASKHDNESETIRNRSVTDRSIAPNASTIALASAEKIDA